MRPRQIRDVCVTIEYAFKKRLLNWSPSARPTGDAIEVTTPERRRFVSRVHPADCNYLRGCVGGHHLPGRRSALKPGAWFAHEPPPCPTGGRVITLAASMLHRAAPQRNPG